MTREEAATVLENALVCCGNAPVEATFEAGCDEVCDALQLAISALREQEVLTQPQDNLTQWISVEERLPEESGRYLTLKKISGYTLARLVSWTHYYDGFEEHLRGRSVWYDHDSEWGDYEVNDITYWMPLPEPPEVEV